MRKTDTILVIEDDLTEGKRFQNYLQKTGYRVLLTSSPMEALSCLKNETIDAILCDLQLSELDGVSLIRKALLLQPDLATVVMTRSGTLESSIEAIRLGVCDYLIMPFSEQKLLTSLEQALKVKWIGRKESPITSSKYSVRQNVAPEFIAESKPMREILQQVQSFSHLDIPILLNGEVGVGKKTLARFIHENSDYADAPFVYHNCSMPIGKGENNNLENALLNPIIHASSKDGSLRGTILLEDIDQLPQFEQRVLVGMIEDGKIVTPWFDHSEACTLRLIASTTVDICEKVSQDGFNRCLYDYLNILPIKVPPLRERRDAIKTLGIHFLEKLSREFNGDPADYRRLVDQDLWDTLVNYQWPGNLQELATVLSRVILLGRHSGIQEELKQSEQQERQYEDETISVPLKGDLKSIEQHIIKEMVRRCGGNKAQAARILGVHRKSLYRILKQTPEII